MLAGCIYCTVMHLILLLCLKNISLHANYLVVKLCITIQQRPFVHSSLTFRFTQIMAEEE